MGAGPTSSKREECSAEDIAKVAISSAGRGYCKGYNILCRQRILQRIDGWTEVVGELKGNSGVVVAYSAAVIAA